jgi:hypothetical protein
MQPIKMSKVEKMLFDLQCEISRTNFSASWSVHLEDILEEFIVTGNWRPDRWGIDPDLCPAPTPGEAVMLGSLSRHLRGIWEMRKDGYVLRHIPDDDRFVD